MYKVLNYDFNNRGFQYQDGLNTIDKDMTQWGVGLYYADREHIHHYLHYGTWLVELEIPSDAVVMACEEGGEGVYKSDKIIIVKKHLLYTPETDQMFADVISRNIKNIENRYCRNYYHEGLIHAATIGNLDMVKYMLRFNIPINSIYFAVSMADIYSHLEIVDVLLENSDRSEFDRYDEYIKTLNQSIQAPSSKLCSSS